MGHVPPAHTPMIPLVVSYLFKTVCSCNFFHVMPWGSHSLLLPMVLSLYYGKVNEGRVSNMYCNKSFSFDMHIK